MAHNLDLVVLHQNIKSAIATAFPDFKTVEFYEQDRREVALPAILFELEDMELSGDDDAGTEQLPVVSKWVARIILSDLQADADLKLRKIAGALGALVHRNRWGAQVSPAMVTVMGPDAFGGGMGASDKWPQNVWAVEWDQKLDLGANIWEGGQLAPGKVMVGFAPDVGTGNAPKYSQEVGDT